ncbi:MAG TPA: hypothetical protein VLM40_13705 [Gemmata sp.]|nr:hypothetical protein [Gemmata sp.]
MRRTTSLKPTLLFASVSAALGAGVATLPGCGKPPGGIVDSTTVVTDKEKPWKQVAKLLRKETDSTTCRSALSGLNADLANDASAPQPRGLSPQEEEALAKLVPLTKDDRDEIRSSAFSAHDAAYLAECLYLRDAVLAFDIPNVPDERPDHGISRRADTAFAWVCRQVYLHPWLIPVPNTNGFQASSLSPSAVLRRGYGSGLERMYVFLGLLQQMGLDGCLVGPPDAGGMPSGFIAHAEDGTAVLTGTPRGPFWAVGVRVGNDVRLYDPWRGRPFPATLNQLKANPESQKAWFEDKENVSGITAELAKKATAFLAAPVNSLAPRMASLEEQLKPDIGVKLAVNAAALRDAFPEPKPAFWNPPQDQFSYGRTARLFLPVDLGGAAPAGMQQGLYTSYVYNQLPPEGLLLPQELLQHPEVMDDVKPRILALARLSFGGAFILAQPTPRERFQRGQFMDAAREIVKKEEAFSTGLLRLRKNPDHEAQIKEWAEKAVALYTDQGRALANRDQEGLAVARAAIEEHWTKPVAVRFLLDRAISTIGLAEAKLLLAECKHEQAERLQSELECAIGDTAKLKQEAKNAWADACHAWSSYGEYTAAHAGFPGRVEHAKKLTTRAEAMAGKT